MSRRGLKVVDWNKNHRVGDEVLLRLDDGREVRTRTQTAAHLLGGHTAVIWLVGFPGCWMLDRVKGVV